MSYLIVNADDLGLSPGVNRGIIDAHTGGVLTSASLIVNSPWTEDAVQRLASVPGLSVGLHVNLRPDREGRDPEDVRRQLRMQARRFYDLVGRAPAHIDSHHNDHEGPDLLPHFEALSTEYRVSLRGHSPIRSLTSFYGQWGGESHPEQIDVAGLTALLKGVGEGVTELSCHPGYVDSDLRSSYANEREIEVSTLCDPRVPQALRMLGVELIGSRDAARLLDGFESREGVWSASTQR